MSSIFPSQCDYVTRSRSFNIFKAPYLLARLRRPRLKPVAEHLPERDAVGPDIGGGGELEEVDALRRAPRYGKLQVGVEVGLVVVLADPEGAGEAEVGDLDGLLGEDEDVARGQVAVDQPLGLQVLHAVAYLVGVGDECVAV